MKLNLGCGRDYKQGYVNVDLNQPCDEEVDLSVLPWKWEDSSADEIMMLDFLEHFPYDSTEKILFECWRVLRPGGSLIIQVPDFEHCANAAMNAGHFLCNVCGNSGKNIDICQKGIKKCSKCQTPLLSISYAAIKRLYGGQDRKGNWHYTAFTKELLEDFLSKNGFDNFEYLEKHHQFLNWNFKIKARKNNNVW